MSDIKVIGARKKQAVTIGEKDFIFKEISLSQMLELFGYKSFSEITEKKETENIFTYFIRIKEIFEMSTGLKIDELQELSFSQLQEIYNIFKEVNSSFFDLGKTLKMDGLPEMISKIKDWVIRKPQIQEMADLILTRLSTSFAILQQQGTSNAGDMGGDSPVNVLKTSIKPEMKPKKNSLK